jgi:XRE family transcriptional regulator, regulator of sulfur utilization
MGTRRSKTSHEALFGMEVARLRKRLGISQEELAFRAAVHGTYISQLERGFKSPTLHVMLKLSCTSRRDAG